MRGIGLLGLSTAWIVAASVGGAAARPPRADAYAPAPDAMDYQESQARYGPHAPVPASMAPSLSFAHTAQPLPRAAARYSLWPGSVPRPVPSGLAAGTLSPRRPPSAGERAFKEGRGLYVEIDVEGKDLRDAVAGLTRAAGFRLEGRKLPEPAAGRGGARVRGWLRGERLGAAAAMPRVRRIEVLGTRAPERPSPREAMTDVLVGLRLPEEVPPARALRRVLTGLARAEFEAGRVVGYQGIPGTTQSALIVSGRLPIRRIGLLLADPSVVKIAPAPSSPETRRGPAAPRGPWLRRFLAFAADRHPALLGAAALLTFSIFIPTHRRPRKRQRPLLRRIP